MAMEAKPLSRAPFYLWVRGAWGRFLVLSMLTWEGSCLDSSKDPSEILARFTYSWQLPFPQITTELRFLERLGMEHAKSERAGL